MRYILMAVLFVFFFINSGASAAEDDIFEIEADGCYRMEAGSSVALAKKVALFTATRKAVELAGRYLLRNSLIEVYGLEKDEIYCLTAREVQAELLEEKIEAVGKASIYSVRIRVRVQASDFIKADVEDTKLEQEEINESYREEMEQHVSVEIDPGRDIAKAYRLLREKKWRLAMIYLNHLEIKYPNWNSIYMAKAVTHYILQEPERMKKALEDACRLGHHMACDDLSKIKNSGARLKTKYQ